MPSETLRLVLDRLPGKWIQGQWHDIENCRCLAGWVTQACNPTGNPHWSDTLTAAMQYIARAANIAVGDIISWNDMSGRTEKEVIALVTKAWRLAQLEEAAVGI